MGILGQGLFVESVKRISADADARRDAKFLPDQGEWFCDRRQYLFGNHRGMLDIAQFLKEHHKLVSSQARDGVALPHAEPKALCNILEQLISGSMPQRIIDLLETIEIEKRHRETAAISMCLADALVQQLAEHAAVRQTRETIVVGEVFGPLCVFELDLALTKTALSQLPTHAPQQRRQHDDRQASGAGAPPVGARLTLGASQLLVGREPNENGEGKTV